MAAPILPPISMATRLESGLQYAYILWSLQIEISSVNFFDHFRPNQAGAAARNATVGALVGIEPVSMRFRCSALTKRATKSNVSSSNGTFLKKITLEIPST
jgi:hypothetical protein